MKSAASIAITRSNGMLVDWMIGQPNNVPAAISLRYGVSPVVVVLVTMLSAHVGFMIQTGLRILPLVPVISAVASTLKSAIMPSMVVRVELALSVTPLRNPAGRVVSAAVASSSTVSIATLVSSTMA